jgi:hypothetical protein
MRLLGVRHVTACREETAGPIQSITLVLRRGSNLPNEAHDASICEALTGIVALVRGKPSGVRIADWMMMRMRRLCQAGGSHVSLEDE